jgi:hypothetical protein
VDYLTMPARPVQRAGSLLAAADTPTARLDRILAGVGHRAGACTGWRLYDPCGEGGTVDHGSDLEAETVQGQPFPIQVDDGDCELTIADSTEEPRVAAARDRLLRIESAAIAREFWTGELATAAGWADNQRLAAAGDVTVVSGAGAVSITAGLAALEQALGDALAGAPGALHMTRGTLVHVAKTGPAPRREGDLLLTLTDHRVIADAGYPGTNPDGDDPDAGEAWIYGTARPVVWRSDVFTTPPALDRDVNRMRASAEEYALVNLTCGVFAARITLT